MPTGSHAVSQKAERVREVRSSASHQLREWYAGRQRGGGAGPCTYVLRTGDRTGEQCGGPHSTQRCFGRLTDAWRHQFPDATEIPRWGDLSRAGVAVFDLDYDAILAAMYALSTSDEGDCYLCVPPDPGIEAAALGAGETAALGASASAALGAGESAPSGTASAQVFHTFTLDSGASRSFFRDRTTLTPLSRPVAVSLADPSGGPVLASFSTVLPCPAAPSGSLSGLYLPSFSTNLVSGADLQDQGVDQFTPASQRVTHCTCARTGRHLATFTLRPGSSLYTLSTESPPVSASGQVAVSSQVLAAASGSGPESAPCSCRLLSHQTLLWHHRLGHPSLPRLRGMASRVLGRSALLVLDSYRGHLTKEVKKKIAEYHIVPAVIPAGCTAEVQPLNVAINKSFKASVRQQQHQETAPVGKLKWFSKAWRAMPAKLNKKAFMMCGISNALDGSEDKLAMAHRRSQLTHEVDVDDEIQADGFWDNNCQEPESDEEE
ncbi:unnamed protein product [Closterium sp. NIES-54]